MRARNHRGFTLVELVVVVLVLGILAAVAAPKLFDTAGDARDSGTRQSIAVIRDAMELHRAREGGYPAAATFAADLADYLRGPFPAPEVGGNAGDNNVAPTGQDPITAASGGTEGWIYNAATGEFRINDLGFLAW
jgi:general secretion pathway protein G